MPHIPSLNNYEMEVSEGTLSPEHLQCATTQKDSTSHHTLRTLCQAEDGCREDETVLSTSTECSNVEFLILALYFYHYYYYLYYCYHHYYYVLSYLSPCHARKGCSYRSEQA